MIGVVMGGAEDEGEDERLSFDRAIAARLAVVEFERKFAGAGWVKVTPAPGPLGWTVRSGKWEGQANDTLVNHGTDSQGLIVFKGRTGSKLEVRGES